MFSWEEFFAHLHRALPGLGSVFFCELSPWFGLEYILPMIYVMWHGAQFGALGPDAELGGLPRFLLRVTPALTTAWWIYQAVLFAMWIPVANDLMCAIKIPDPETVQNITECKPNAAWYATSEFQGLGNLVCNVCNQTDWTAMQLRSHGTPQ